MTTQEILRSTVAEYFGTTPERVDADFPISGTRVQGSLGRAQLDAAIRRRTGIKSAAVYTAKTFGEIAAAALAEPATEPQSPQPTSVPAANKELVAHRELAPQVVSRQPTAAPSASVEPRSRASRLRCGVDFEAVGNLPPAADYWEHEFYKQTFTPSEIAYCVMKDSPRIHFAGRWCAKEALKKCDAAFLQEDMARIEVASQDSGAVSLRHYREGQAIDLPHALSITHTDVAALAIVIIHEGDPAAEPPAQPTDLSPTSTGRMNALGWAAFSLSAIAAVAALIALYRTM